MTTTRSAAKAEAATKTSTEAAVATGKRLKSVITCDLEGRLETFGKDAEAVFGYSADEVVGKARVSLFSPGLVVLGHVASWLETARREGAFEGRTVFVRKDGTPFAADIKITPTKKNGVQIGYCGVTTPRPDVPVAEAMPPISLWTRVFKWLVITRAPFLTASLVPLLLGAALAVAWGDVAGAFPWGLFSLAMVGGLALHVAANTLNDYYDWTSGTDQANTDYFMPFSGGSRAIELGLVSPKGMRNVGLAALAVATAIGAVLLTVRGPELLVFGAIGAFSAIFYTAPPLRLVARKGLGELFIGLNFGPLMLAGMAYVVSGQLDARAFLAGLPVGLLTTAILWVNEFPDARSDALTGKNHLVVVLGKAAARWGYLALMVAAFGSAVALVAADLVPAGALWMLAGVPLALWATQHLFRHYQDRELVRANAATIGLHLVAGLLMAGGVLWG